jgi:hypothetical protein
MAPDERDRIIDKALARHLRSATPTGEAAGMRGVPASQSDACPDPEMLAAYHERSLLPEQLNSLKEHIVGCANCQTVLAHLETTDEIPLQAAQEHQVLAVKESEPVMAARNLETMPAAEVPGQSQRPVGAAPPRKSRRVLLLRGARWQWLAPAGAIAAGLLVWIALHENRPLALPALPESENKVAQNRAPAAPLPSDSITAPQPSAPSKPAATLTRPQSANSEPAIANGRMTSGATRQRQTLSVETGARAADSLTDKEVLARKDRERDASTDELTAANRADLDAKNLPEDLRKKEDATAQAEKAQAEIAQLQNSQTQNQTNNVSPKVAGPSPLNQVESSKRAKSAAAAAPAPAAPPPQPGVAGGVASRHNDAASLKFAVISNPRLISPPGSNAIWRAGRNGLIEFSADEGSSWARQTSGVLTDLLTGSAPSDQVCWIVGRVGAILLTTDGGAHWTVIPPPLTEDLGGVHASDALHATIWNARGTKSFETGDGGLTWKPVPNP